MRGPGGPFAFRFGTLLVFLPWERRVLSFSISLIPLRRTFGFVWFRCGICAGVVIMFLAVIFLFSFAGGGGGRMINA